MKKKTLIKLLSKPLKKKCPERFSLSGSEAENNDYFSLHIDMEGEPYLLLRNIDEGYVECLQWDGKRYNDNVKIDVAEIELNKIDITHYHKTSIINFNSINNYRLHRITRLIYISEFVKRRFGKFRQYLFNKKNLVLKKRTEILKTILTKYFEDTNFKFNSLSILSLVHSSKRWILHPKHDMYIKEMDEYLDSFVHSGDLSKSGLTYHITPKAIVTLSAFEEEERKYLSQMKISRRMMWPTFAIAFFAFVQLLLKYLENKPQ